MLKELIRKKSDKSLISVSGGSGYFTTIFKPNTKVYIFDVSIFSNKGLEKIEWKFDKKTNKLECWTLDKYYYGYKQFAIRWKESDYFKRINI